MRQLEAELIQNCASINYPKWASVKSANPCDFWLLTSYWPGEIACSARASTYHTQQLLLRLEFGSKGEGALFRWVKAHTGKPQPEFAPGLTSHRSSGRKDVFKDRKQKGENRIA